MEIVFNKLSLIENKSTNKEIKYLDNVSLTINEGSIVGISGDNISVISNLLMVIKRPSKGELKLDDLIIKRTSHINNVNMLRKRIGVLDTKNNFVTKSVKEEIKLVMKNYEYKTKNENQHIVDSLKIAGLSEDYLDRNPNELSMTEKKKFNLACLLSYNPEVIILEDFYKGLIYREREYYKKLFLKLKNNFKKTIIILGNDLTFMFNLVDNLYVINKGKVVVSGDKDIFYKDELYSYLEMPKIVEFTKYAQSKDHKILEYTDLKELIKELYRNVK